MVLAHNIDEGSRTQDIQINVDVTFDSMLLSKHTLQGLVKSGFHKPSPIQLHGIPLGKCGFDLFLEAKSGTGKTAVFTVIALEKLHLNSGLQVIILAPTREIAAQISDVIKQIGCCYEGLNVEVVMGGIPLEEDIIKLQKKVQILVGSPGRMRHLIQDQHINVSAVRLLVLDEADKLIDKSFQADINYIFSILPKQKQVIMSSATFPSPLKSVMQNYVKKVQHICPDSTSVLLGIKQSVTTVKYNVNVVRQTKNRFEELLKILATREFKQCLIFCNYQVRVEELCKMLTREKWPAEQLHGQLEQTERLGALKTLQEYKCRILISTDLAARGIDASNVDLVINFEPPIEWQTYLHRIGRAGRFGSYGIAITILSEGKEKDNFKELIKSISSTLTLNNLWDNSVFELDKSDKHATLHENTKHVIITSEIEKLSELDEEQSRNSKDILDSKPCEEPKCDTTKNIGGHAILTKLFHSFEKPKEHKIESFDELIASFQVHEPNNNEKSEINDITFKKYFDTMLNEGSEANVPKSNSDNEHDKEKNIQIEFENVKQSLTTHIHVETQSSKDFELKKGNNSKTDDVLNMKQISLNRKQHALKSNFKPDTSSTYNALKDAGLPTSFGSTKYCTRKSNSENKHIYHTGNLKNIHEKSNNISYKKSNIKNEYQTNRNNVLKGTTSKNSSEGSLINIDDDGYNTQSCLFSRSTKYMPSQNKQSQNTFCTDNISSSCSEMSYDGVRLSNSDAHKNYITWYNQLKAHVKQVEMCLYIDELSKM